MIAPDVGVDNLNVFHSDFIQKTESSNVSTFSCENFESKSLFLEKRRIVWFSTISLSLRFRIIQEADSSKLGDGFWQ
jgi:hypothetical protein